MEKTNLRHLRHWCCALAAERTGRRCYGMEIDPRYVQVALARWEAETGGQAVLEAEGIIA